MNICGVEFSEFTICKHKEKPKLKVESGWGLFDGKRSISIHAHFNEKRDMRTLMSSEDENDIELFKEICIEFNNEANWDKAYLEALEYCAAYFARNIKKETDNLAEINEKIKAEKSNKIK